MNISQGGMIHRDAAVSPTKQSQERIVILFIERENPPQHFMVCFYRKMINDNV